MFVVVVLGVLPLFGAAQSSVSGADYDYVLPLEALDDEAEDVSDARASSQLPVLVRNYAVVPCPPTEEVVLSRKKLALFLGIIFHAINTMNGQPTSRLRGGFIPMLCYAMKKFIAIDDKVAWDQLEEYRNFITAVAVISKESTKPFLTDSVVEGLVSAFKRFHLGTGKLCQRLRLQCQSPSGIKFEDDFFAFMEQNRLAFETTVPLPQAPLIGLQCYLYKAVADECADATGVDAKMNRKRTRWLGAVHHYMRFVLGHKYAALAGEDHTSKAFLWVDYAPISGIKDFFSSVEFLDCIQTFIRAIHYDGEGIPLSKTEHWSCSFALIHEMVLEFRPYESLKALAERQYEIICTKPIVFMAELLKAFEKFQKRLDPEYLLEPL